jgi:hypothetical protein
MMSTGGHSSGGKRPLIMRWAGYALAAALLAVIATALSGCSESTGQGSSSSGPPRDTVPVVLEVSTPGTLLVDNDKAT